MCSPSCCCPSRSISCACAHRKTCQRHSSWLSVRPRCLLSRHPCCSLSATRAAPKPHSLAYSSLPPRLSRHPEGSRPSSRVDGCLLAIAVVLSHGWKATGLVIDRSRHAGLRLSAIPSISASPCSPWAKRSHSPAGPPSWLCLPECFNVRVARLRRGETADCHIRRALRPLPKANQDDHSATSLSPRARTRVASRLPPGSPRRQAVLAKGAVASVRGMNRSAAKTQPKLHTAVDGNVVPVPVTTKGVQIDHSQWWWATLFQVRSRPAC